MNTMTITKTMHTMHIMNILNNTNIMNIMSIMNIFKIGDTFLYLEKEGEPLVVETKGDSDIKVGDTVKVGFSASHCHIFNSSNQEAFK